MARAQAVTGSQPLLPAAPGQRLDARGVTKRFGPLTVLHDVSVTVSAGEVVALVGETGAGKSTLVSCIGRILDMDAGDIALDGMRLPADPSDVRRAGVEVVWQDGGLCDDLDVLANLILGRERRVLRVQTAWDDAALRILNRIGVDSLPLDRAVGSLSRGQRQLVALARAFVVQPRLLVLDDPTAPLSVPEASRIYGLVRELRDAGSGVLLVTHDLEQAFGLADRIVVLRHGRVVADVSPFEVQRADVVALMSGIEMDSAARRQLDRLGSLVDQLSDVDPAASLPLIVSSMAAALEQDKVCVHLLQVRDDGTSVLQRTAAVGLPAPLLKVTESLPLGAAGGCAGLAAELADVVFVDDLTSEPVPTAHREAAVASGIRSQWAAPIAGSRGVLGTVSGFGVAPGHPEPDRLELARVYLSHAASAIERDTLLTEVSRRNSVLETLSSMLETLAGPSGVDDGLVVALGALRHGLGADSVALVAEEQGALRIRAIDAAREHAGAGLAHVTSAAAEALVRGSEDVLAVQAGTGLAAAPLHLPETRGALVAHWSGAVVLGEGLLELLRDAARSLALAMEGQAVHMARREATALRRSQAVQRELLSSLSHELRTPLTAIHGYASTLCQPDLTWDAESTDRFLRSIALESARMERLVGDLLDATAIESGILRLQRDWVDLRLVTEAACGVVSGKTPVRIHVRDALEPVWADHDRLEQVLVNLLENAATHGNSDHGVDVTLRLGTAQGTVEIEVSDRGEGLPDTVGERIFQARVRGGGGVPGTGLGLAISRGIVEAHGGTLTTAGVQRGASFVVTLPTDGPLPSTEGPDQAAWNVAEIAGVADVP